jgi:hypothetical protein
MIQGQASLFTHFIQCVPRLQTAVRAKHGLMALAGQVAYQAPRPGDVRDTSPGAGCRSGRLWAVEVTELACF